MHVHAAPASPRQGCTGRTQTVLRISSSPRWPTSRSRLSPASALYSLALLSESGHNVSDFLALLLQLRRGLLLRDPPTPTMPWTFGYQRAGVLAAFINAGTLILISIWIGIEAIQAPSTRRSPWRPAS